MNSCVLSDCMTFAEYVVLIASYCHLVATYYRELKLVIVASLIFSPFPLKNCFSLRNERFYVRRIVLISDDAIRVLRTIVLKNEHSKCGSECMDHQ